MSFVIEYYSVCCNAPPLYELHDNGEYEKLDLCMSCRKKTEFNWEVGQDE